MALETQPNGPRPTLTTGRNRNTLQNIRSKQDPNSVGKSSALTRGGRILDPSAAVEKMRQARRPPTPASAPSTQQILPGARDFSAIGQAHAAATQNIVNSTTGAILAKLVAQRRNGGSSGPIPAGTRAQLVKGFLDAGRPDLAKMVKTRSFDTWIGQESGWDTDVVSPANNQGLRNGGLFQIWYGHDFSNPYEHAGRFSASAYQQAKLVAQHFSHLDPSDIRRYARAIRAGNYKGWG